MLIGKLAHDVVVSDVDQADNRTAIEQGQAHDATQTQVDDALGSVEMFVVERISHDDGLSRFEDVVDDGVGKQVVVDRLLIEIARDVADDFSVAYDEQKAFVGVHERNDVVDGMGEDGIDVVALR